MHLHNFVIENIRSIKKLRWEVPRQKEAGWHVIIGDNGSGKSSVIRSLALAFVGPQQSGALREDFGNWLRREENSGRIAVNLDHHRDFDRFSGRGRPVERYYLLVSLHLKRVNGYVRLLESWSPVKPDRHIWGGKAGWFSASYGPFRRFTGGDKELEKLFYSNPRLARHLSIFGESVALTESLKWLQELKFKQLEKVKEGGLLDLVTDFVNQGDLLPNNVRLREISSSGVMFVDGNGCEVAVENLSDGYRSILSMTFELIRQLSAAFESHHIFDPKDTSKVISPGVVLIDEIDAHLHPTWQRKVGLWFRKYFPKMQFIVATHSPLICQAADAGSVFRLAKPGSEQPSAMIEGDELNRLIYGNVLDAYSTEAFGPDVTRSDESRRRLKRLAELNRKELRGKLSGAERKERDRLRLTMPTAAHTTDAMAAE